MFKNLCNTFLPLFLISIIFAGCSVKKEIPPNILFIMSDDHAEQAISCYGSKLINTPNIDRIANEGIRFTNSFVTNSICGPSRAVLLTGKYSHLNGFRDNRDLFDSSQTTFPKLLQKAGYETHVIGKWHLRSTPTGFDNWKILKGQGQYYNPLFLENGKENIRTGYTTDIITDLTIEALENRSKEKPFCMLIHHKAPHRNWMPNAKYFEEFENIEFPLPETFYDEYKTREKTAGHADMRIDDMYLSFDLKLHKNYYDKETGTGGNAKFASKVELNWLAIYNRMNAEQKKLWDGHYNKINEEFKKANLKGNKLLEWKYQQYMKDYLRCILSVDESIGRILNYLDENGLAKNTIVVYTSDQGFYLGEHGWYDKRFMYEESHSMPLVIRYPKQIPSGQVSDLMALNLDFAPTFLDFANVTIPNDVQGNSLRNILENNKTDNWRKSVYYHYYEYPHGWHKVKKHCGVRTEDHKLIHFYDDDIWELYDLKKDPNELKNIYTDPSYADINNDLKNELSRLQKEYKDSSF
ncbi:MAG: sulfatase [Melioribacteraceae bacterium]|nr:sulfatase [Melioribacteraceae bacterium]